MFLKQAFIKKLLGAFVVVSVLTAISFSGDVANSVLAEDAVAAPEEQVLEPEVTTPEPIVIELPAPEVSSESGQASEEDSVSTDPAISVTSEVSENSSSEISPELSTDKDDYHPGETATIFGKFFQGLSDFILKVFGSDENDQNYTETTITVTTDESGSFSSAFNLDSLYRPFYEMTASDLSGNVLASGWFRDSAVGTYDQCANDDGDGYNGNPGECNWINGNLQANNSTYYEGSVTPQRLWLKGLVVGDPHTVTFKYGTTKAGSHAYDYLTAWDKTEDWIQNPSQCEGITGCESEADDNSAVMENDPELTDDIEPQNGRYFTIRGGTIDDVSIPTIVSGDYDGDSETAVTVNFTVNDSAMCTTSNKGIKSCGVAIWFGAHVAETAEWDAEIPGSTGAGAISGSPYHVALAAIDGDPDTDPQGGGRDNQMSANLITVTPPQATISGLKWNDADSSGTINNNEGPLSGWTIFIDGNTNGNLDGNETSMVTGIDGAYSFANLEDGEYSICEEMQNGWTQTYPAGDGCHTVVVNGVDDTDNNFGNRELKATLTLLKTVVKDNGGTALDTDWTLSASGPTSISGTEGQTAITSASVNPGVYTLSESDGPAGYSPSAWVCPGKTVNAGQITLLDGDNITCTITNDDIPAHLIVIKHVINDNGGSAGASAFTTTISGVTTATPSAPGVESPGVDNVLTSVGAYSVDEGAHVGYDRTLSDDCSGSIALGQTKTCTITNDDIAPSLTLNKIVDNGNGGTKLESNWTLTANDGLAGTLTGPGAVGSTDVVSDVAFKAGTYALSESGDQTGYLASVWSCVKNANPAVNGASITLGLGDVATCTIINDDIAPKLTLVKHVDNGNGGAAVETDWTLTATGPTNISGAGGVVSGATFKAGEYTLSESTDPSGYTASGWTCDNEDNDGTISLALADDVTCEITNDDIAPILHLRKIIVNNNGGQATVANFTLTADGTKDNNDLTGVTPVDSTGTLKADTWALSETGPAGYSASAWSCVGGTQDGSNITVGIGGEATCTITNDDIAPRLTVIKHVINDNGGTNVAGDFTMNVSANSPSSSSFPGVEAPGTTITLLPGAYSVTETKPNGYIGTLSTECSGNIDIGQTKICTITNDDTPGHFTGGGSIFVNALKTGSKKPDDGRVTHGFTLHCDANRGPNRLEINWAGTGKGKASENNFHLTSLISAVCTDETGFGPGHPNADFDTITGTGTGKLNGVEGATITFTFDDHGEPGKNDRVNMVITGPGGGLLNTGGFLTLNVGNQQAHQDN